MRKILVLLACIFCIMSSSQAQYLSHKIDLGISSGIQIPLNDSYIIGEEGFRYPSLFGNYSPGFAYGVYSEYQASPLFRIGLCIHHARFSSWKGDENVFILEDPLLSLSTISLGGLFFPGIRPLLFNGFTWGLGFYPLMVYQSASWSNIAIIDNNSIIEPYQAMDLGFRTGISFLYEINNNHGVRVDLYYQVQNVDSHYYLDRSFHSLNATFSFFLKLYKNRVFRYD